MQAVYETKPKTNLAILSAPKGRHDELSLRLKVKNSNHPRERH